MSDPHDFCDPAEDRRTLLSALDALSDGVAILNRETGAVTANAAYRRALGSSPQGTSLTAVQSALEMTLSDGSAVPPDQWPAARALRGDFVRSLELTLRRPDAGAQLVAEFSTAALRSESGRDHSVVVTFRDVTERRRQSIEIGRLNRLYATLSEVNQVIVRCSKRPELFDEICRIGIHFGKFGAVSIAWQAAGTSSFATVASRMEAAGAAAPGWSDFCGACRAALRSGSPVVCNDARMCPCAESCHPTLIESGFLSCGAYPLLMNGTVCGTITLCSREPDFFNGPEDKLLREVAGDISFALDKFEREAERRKMAELIADGGRLAKIGNWERNFVTGKAILSQEIYRIFGRDSALGPVAFAELPQYFAAESWPRLKAAIGEALEHGTPFVVEAQITRTDGEQIWGVCRGEAFANEDGARVGVRGTIQDVTERMRIQTALEERENQLRLYAEHCPAAVAMFDESMRYMVVSRRWIEDYHLEGIPIRGRTHYEVFPDLPDRWKAVHQRCLAGAIERCEGEPFVRSDGATSWIRWEIRPWRRADESIGGIMIFSEDITALKRQMESIELFRALIEHSGDGIYVADPATGRFLDANARGCASLGYTRAELLERRSFDVVQGLTPEFYAATNRLLRAQAHASVEMLHVRKDGSTFLGEAHLSLVTLERDYLLVIVRDITEARKLEHQALRSQRLEAIGTLSNGIAHDLNNILTPILMAAGLLGAEAKGKREAELLQLIETEGVRGAKIIQQLLTFSRGQPGKRAIVQLRPLIQDLTNLMRETFPRNLVLREQAGFDLGTILGDVTQLHQVLLNLCVNARDAMPRGGVLTVRAETAELTPEVAADHPEAKLCPHVLLTASDTGDGISPEIIDRIFDPFFTTKEPGQGTGLGLSTVLGIVKGHGGFLTVESVPGKGSAFRVYLPCAEGTVPAGDRPRSLPRRGGGELVLVVDDEPSIIAVTRAALIRQGYRVVSARDGVAGKAVFDDHRNEIRVAVIDQMMPVMSGEALIAAIRAERTATRIIAVTGMSQVEQLARLEGSGISEVILKPYSPQQLLEAIDRALDPVRL